mgnify:FL=1
MCVLRLGEGQRKYGGPPPGWDGSPPGAGCEVFCGKIPKDMYEDELIPLFEACGTIWDLRLMMDPMTGTNRGYAFVTFTTREAAQLAVQKVCENGGWVDVRCLTEATVLETCLIAVMERGVQVVRVADTLFYLCVNLRLVQVSFEIGDWLVFDCLEGPSSIFGNS